MHVSRIVINHFKRGKTLALISIVGLAAAIASILLFRSYRDYYTDSVGDIFPQEDDIVIVSEDGIPYFQIIPYGSRLNETIVNQLRAGNPLFTGIKMVVPVLFVKYADVGGAGAFTDLIAAFPMNMTDPFSRAVMSEKYLLDGTLPSPGTNEIAVGLQASNGTLELGDTMPINGHGYTVVGIFQPQSMLFNHVIMADLGIIQAEFSYTNIVTCVIVEHYLETFAQAKNNIESMTSDDIQVVNSMDLQQVNGVINIANILSDVIFSVFITVISILFMVIVMFKKVQNHEKEIKLLHALGTSGGRIVCNFLAESLVLSILGYVIGLQLGSTIFSGIFLGLNQTGGRYFAEILQSSFFFIDPALFWITLLFSLLVSIVSVLYPLYKVLLIEHPRLTRLFVLNLHKPRRGEI